jgi:hypothetical protein
MKNLLFIALSLICSALTTSSDAQVFTPGGRPPLESWGQLWSIGTYGNTTAGTQRDTSGTSIKLRTAKFVSGVTTVQDLPGTSSTITFSAYCWKGQKTATTVNPVCTATLMFSSDATGSANSFQPVVGATVFTLTATSATTPVYCAWSGIAKNARYYGINFTVTTDTPSVAAGYYLQNPSENYWGH